MWISGSPVQLWHCIQMLDNVSFQVKAGLHQGSVLSPLLFAIVMDVVYSEARRGLPSELLYADDIVMMAPTMEQLGRRMAKCRAIIFDKVAEWRASGSK